MAPLHAGQGTCLVPILLTLPPGVVAGISSRPRSDSPCLASDLAAFGPEVRADGELRHAVRRPPARVVVEADCVTPALLEAALPALQQAGTVVVLRSADQGVLARLAELVLQDGGEGAAWIGTAGRRARRCLEFRVVGTGSAPAAWIRVPLDGAGGAEAVLSAARADGIVVRESRIVYEPPR